MRWLKSHLRGSIYGLFSPPLHARSPYPNAADAIREAMLEALSNCGSADLHRRVRYASDVQSLWYLRAELMAVLASVHGEAEARRQVRAISAPFRDTLPRGMVPRPSRLAS